MNYVYKDKSWQIINYKNIYYIELYENAICVYSNTFELICRRRTSNDYYSHITVVEDTLFAQSNSSFIDVMEIPSLEKMKRIQWKDEKGFERTGELLYLEEDKIVFSGLYSDLKDISVVTMIDINTYEERVVWRDENAAVKSIFYSDKMKDYLILYRKIYYRNNKEVFVEEILLGNHKKKILQRIVRNWRFIYEIMINSNNEMCCFIDGCGPGSILNMEEDKIIAKDVELVAASNDKKKIAYLKKNMLYVYSWEKNAHIKKIKMQMKTHFYEIQFVDDKYIAVRGSDYMYWYEL